MERGIFVHLVFLSLTGQKNKACVDIQVTVGIRQVRIKCRTPSPISMIKKLNCGTYSTSANESASSPAYFQSFCYFSLSVLFKLNVVDSECLRLLFVTVYLVILNWFFQHFHWQAHGLWFFELNAHEMVGVAIATKCSYFSMKSLPNLQHEQNQMMVQAVQSIYITCY